MATTKVRSKPWQQIREEHSKLNADDRAVIDQGVAERVSGLKLAELRRARHMTQETLAQTMGAAQSDISRIEHNADVYMSTLRKYVQAMGGRLELSVTFGGGQEYTIDQFQDLAEAPTRKKKRPVAVRA
jgi:DNA-binding XRE family transcriptional regulator